jgi:hypothetical protein
VGDRRKIESEVLKICVEVRFFIPLSHSMIWCDLILCGADQSCTCAINCVDVVACVDDIAISIDRWMPFISL